MKTTFHCLFKITALLFDKMLPTFAFSTRLFMKHGNCGIYAQRNVKLVTEKEYLCAIYKKKNSKITKVGVRAELQLHTD